MIPAYNEASHIDATVHGWSGVLRRLNIHHELLVYDDGSTDGTGALLDAAAAMFPELHVHHHVNRGHGPTVLAGYRAARGEWILQIDGDDEVGPAPFERMWNDRDRVDFLIGRRTGRDLTPARRVLTRATGTAVRVLFGGAVSDPNAPYRLMRRSMVGPLVAGLPAEMFAPNVALTGLALREGLRLEERPVGSRLQLHGRSASWNIIRAALTSFVQLVVVARHVASPSSLVQRTTR